MVAVLVDIYCVQVTIKRYNVNMVFEGFVPPQVCPVPVHPFFDEFTPSIITGFAHRLPIYPKKISPNFYTKVRAPFNAGGVVHFILHGVKFSR